MIEILETGPLATIQDAGRPGFAHLGVSRSGAADRAAYALANRLVGNRPGSATVELTLGGLAVRCLDAVTIALTGARCPGADPNVAFTVSAGSELRLAAPPVGVRSYLAVRGGIDAPSTLGSRSTDTLSGIGPRPLRDGDRLAVGRASGAVSGFEAVPRLRPGAIRVLAGPRDELFYPAALGLLVSATWIVRPDSDRIGVRFDGPALRRRDARELPSEPVVPGALQVPPDGRPILLGPDAPVSGGYPVIAVARSDDLDIAAQLRPGDPVRFGWADQTSSR